MEFEDAMHAEKTWYKLNGHTIGLSYMLKPLFVVNVYIKVINIL